MPYGLQVRTNKGLVDLAEAKSFRRVHRSIQNINFGGLSRTFTVSINNFSDMTGRVVLVSQARSVQTGTSWGSALHNDDSTRTNASNFPSSIRCWISSNYGSSSDTSAVFEIFAMQVE